MIPRVHSRIWTLVIDMEIDDCEHRSEVKGHFDKLPKSTKIKRNQARHCYSLGVNKVITSTELSKIKYKQLQLRHASLQQLPLLLVLKG